jgi:hypothetical protein
VLTGSTKCEPLPDAKNILVTGGAGFMYVDCMGEAGEFAGCATHQAGNSMNADASAEHVGLPAIWS